MPHKASNPITGEDTETVKKCPPFIDAMTFGFLIPLAADLEVRDGEFSWDFELPEGAASEYSHSPIDYHDPSQIAGTPFLDDDRFIIKFNNFWTIEAPARLFAAVHPSGQPHRSAVHHAHRPGRLRHVLSDARSISRRAGMT